MNEWGDFIGRSRGVILLSAAENETPVILISSAARDSCFLILSRHQTSMAPGLRSPSLPIASLTNGLHLSSLLLASLLLQLNPALKDPPLPKFRP